LERIGEMLIAGGGVELDDDLIGDVVPIARDQLSVEESGCRQQDGEPMHNSRVCVVVHSLAD